MVARRSLSHWKLLSTVVIGVLLASTIMAGTVIYFDALRELALKNALNQLTVKQTDILIKANRGPTTVEEYEKIRNAMEGQFRPRLGWLLRDSTRGGRSATFFLTFPGDESIAGDDDARAYFVFSPPLLDHINILPGSRLPNEQALNNPDVPLELEALVPREAAELFGVGVGDRLSAVPFWKDRILYTSVVISGIFERKDPNAEYWHQDDTFFQGSTRGAFRAVPFYISEKTFFEVLGASFFDMDTAYSYLLSVDPGRINANNSTITRQQIARMKSNLTTDLFSYRQLTSLDRTLAEYDQRLFFSKIPMFIILVLIAVVILYYVVTLSSLLVEQQRGEIALLRSRGASSGQILVVFILEGATISLLAILAAPLLASVVISILGFTPAFADLSGNDRLTVTITSGAYMMSALGGLLSFAALLIPAVQASRIGVARHRQESARPAAQPFYQRFYLDIMLLAISIFLFRQLSEQGSVVATGLFGDIAINQVLLAVPALILVAFAMVLLRLFPLSIRFLSGDSPSLMHLIVIGVVTIQAATLVFGEALNSDGFGWLGRLAFVLVLGGLYWATERMTRPSLRNTGLIIQAALVAILMLIPFQAPLIDFVTVNLGGAVVQPGVIGGVLVISLNFASGGGFIPIPLGLLFLIVSAFARRAPVGFSMGMWQMSRNPTHYARLSLLLILMAGLGIFAASFGGTLERSFREQANYSTGADIRVEGLVLNSQGRSISVVDAYKDLPAVGEVGPMIRAFGTDLSKLIGESYTMIGMDGEVINEIGWFRSDFSDEPMAQLLTSLDHPEPPVGILLPEGATTIGVRVKADRPHPSVAVAVRLKDANDRYFTYTLGNLTTSNWIDMETNIRRVSRFRSRSPLQPEHPITLTSLAVHEVIGRNRLRAGSITIDQISAKTPGGEVQVIESFNDTSEWTILRTTRESITDALQPSTITYNGDSGSGLFVWSEGPPLSGRGIFHGPPVNPLPVLASKTFIKNTGHRLGEEFEVSVSGHRIVVRLVDTIDFFPTLDTINKNYLISDLDSLVHYANLETTSSELRPNELWLQTVTNGTDRSRLIEMLTNDEPFNKRYLHDREEVLAASQVDPLVQAGWRALLFMAFAAVLILSCLGFLVHAYVSFREREMQFGLMRTIGFSMGQLVTLVWVEQALVIAMGMILGAEMGRRLGAIIMPFLSHNDRGGQVLPPFVLEINWGTLAITYGFMVFVFTLIILGMIWFIRRISLQRILRLGEV